MRFPEFWSSTFWRHGGAHRTAQETTVLDNAFALIDGVTRYVLPSTKELGAECGVTSERAGRSYAQRKGPPPLCYIFGTGQTFVIDKFKKVIYGQPPMVWWGLDVGKVIRSPSQEEVPSALIFRRNQVALP